MEVYGIMGEKQKAESVYRELKRLLEKELGTEPEAFVEQTAERIRNTGDKIAGVSTGSQIAEDPRCAELLQWISMFWDRAEYRKLKYFSGYGEDVLVELIEKLVKSGKIIETESGGKIFYSFADEEEGKTVYNNMSLTRRRRLHTVMARRFEEQFQTGQNEDLLPRIIYHYFRCGDQKNADRYLK